MTAPLTIVLLGPPTAFARTRLSRTGHFYPLESRCFCPCELCRLRYRRMLYNRKRGGEPLRSYRPGGYLRRRR